HARAVQLGERAAQLRVTPTIHYFLAREYLALDRPVEALAYGGSCARAAEADATLRNRDSVLQACRAVVADTERRVGRVTVRVPAPVPAGLVVRVRGSDLSPALYDVAYPVGVGVVVVEASAPGRRPFRRELRVAAGRIEAVEVSLEVAPVAAAAVAAPVARVPVEPVDSRPRPVGPWILAGGGVAGLVLGAVFYGLATGAQHDRDVATDGMDATGAESFDRSYAGSLEAANWSYAIGAAALVGGATWFVIDRVTRRGSRPAALGLNVAPTARGLTLGLGGVF
ncbi:MAG: hypothetical protein JWM10_1803, partial [Myxococcaceae bacterium]|nr:hypothetical protein [Myxococcaceae bacterium]